MRTKQDGAAWTEAVQRSERHRLRQTVAETDNLDLDAAAVTASQRQTITDADVPIQSIYLDQQAGKSGHPPFDTQRRDIAQPRTTRSSLVKQ